MSEWEIGLASWIIQDGNYPDFHQGQSADFALEFFPRTTAVVQPTAKGARPLGGAEYEITGEVIYRSEDVWVVDFGICVYQTSKPPEEVEVGAFVVSTLYLGVDPYAYWEFLSETPEVPSLVYTWQINRISMQTAPYVENSARVLVRDEEQLGWCDIQQTDAWHDDGGFAEYILHCVKLDEPPKRTSQTVNSGPV